MIGDISSFVDVQNRQLMNNSNQGSKLCWQADSRRPLSQGDHLSPILKDATADVVVGEWIDLQLLKEI